MQQRRALSPRRAPGASAPHLEAVPCCSCLQVDRGHGAVLHHPPHPRLQRDGDGPGGVRAFQAGGPQRLRVPRRSWRQVSPGVSISLGAGGPFHLTPPQKKPQKGKAKGGTGSRPSGKTFEATACAGRFGRSRSSLGAGSSRAPAPLPGTPRSQGPAQPGVPGLGKEPRGCSWTGRSLPARSALQSRRRRLLSLFQRRGLGFPVLLAPHPPGFRHLPGWGQHPDAGLQELG